MNRSKVSFFGRQVELNGELWSRADLHLHTTASDGLMTPEETVEIIASQTRLAVIAITDHDTADGAILAREHALRRHLEIEVIVGQEVSTDEGDVLALFIDSTLPLYRTAGAAIEAIHRAGGLAVAAHPFAVGLGESSVKHAIQHLPFDAVEVRHGCPLNVIGNRYARYLNRQAQNLAELGSSDSHVPYMAGQAYSWFPGSKAGDVREAILTRRVRPGGSLWTLRSILRAAPVILERGWPHYLRSPELMQVEG
jgi:hypothetical protein